MSKQDVTMEFEEMELEVDNFKEEYQIFLCNFTVKAELSYIPARVSGPPEDCYPDESEVDIQSITLDYVSDADGEEVKPSDKLRQALIDALDMDYIYERLWEEWQSEEDRRGDEPDDED